MLRAALGFVVGIEWFTLVDHAMTGRLFSQYNTGLLSVADRPWNDMLAEMMETNHTIYDLLLGKRAPFAWDVHGSNRRPEDSLEGQKSSFGCQGCTTATSL